MDKIEERLAITPRENSSKVMGIPNTIKQKMYGIKKDPPNVKTR